MRYYNDTKSHIPVVITDFNDYTKADFLLCNHYYPTGRKSKWRLSKYYAIFFDGADLHHVMLRKDFDKLKRVKV